MAFKHGVYKSEVPTSIIAPSQNESGLPVIVGTAPITEGDPTCINRPELCYTYEEAVAKFGYSSDWEKYTLCEFMYSQFVLFGQAPCVLINVYDPAKHENDPSKVKAADIIGGVDANGKYSGLELVNQVFSKFRQIPGLIGCPKWSENPAVAAAMLAKADSVSGIFTCSAVVDIPSGSGGAAKYTDVPSWKTTNNYTSAREIVCWPKVKLGDQTFHMSTQLIGLMNRTDGAHDDIPYKSPSNELLQMDSCVTEAGDDILLTLEQANYLNSQGVVTALNWTGGWKSWGNRTGAYPAVTDAKDCFIAVRRMMDFLSNQFITTFWQETDEAMTPRLIRTIVNSFNLYLNSLVAREMLLGGRIEFREDENALTDLLNGILRFHIFITPPMPAETIEGIFEYDTQYLTVLYEALS